MATELRRGEVWSVDFGSDPADPEQAFVRPAVIVSDDQLHDPRLRMCVVVPGTSRIRRVSVHVVVDPDEWNGLNALTAFQVEQVRAVSRDRLQARLGAMDVETQYQLDEVLRMVLRL